MVTQMTPRNRLGRREHGNAAALEHMWTAAGFAEVHRRDFRVGLCPELNTVETRPNSFFIEGVQ